MYQFSYSSKERLLTCHPAIIRIFEEVIQYKDCSIVSGHRTPEEQYKLYQKGRTETEPDVWKITAPEKVVTYRDGYKRLSYHNYFPSLAVDVVPYPSKWSDEEEFKELSRIVEAVQQKLYEEKEIPYFLEWGGNWRNFKDYPHYQLPRIEI